MSSDCPPNGKPECSPAKKEVIPLSEINIRIEEVEPCGKYIRLTNYSQSEEEIGCGVLKQMYRGHRVIEFHFPSRVTFAAGCSITVWAGRRELSKDDPHWNFYFPELNKWGSGCDYATLLCRPNGQIITGCGVPSYNAALTPVTSCVPGILSKFNFITNWNSVYLRESDQEQEQRMQEALNQIDTLDPSTIFKPRIIQSNGETGKPGTGSVHRRDNARCLGEENSF